MTTPRSQVRRDAVMDPVGTAHRIFDLEAEVERLREEFEALSGLYVACRDELEALVDARGQAGDK